MKPDKPRTRSRLAWFAWRLARVAILVYLGALLIMVLMENSFIFIPSKYPEGDWKPKGFTFEDAEFTAADGTKLHGWYAPVKNPTAVVLFCHGNAGNVTHRDDLFYTMQTFVGASVLVFDYRGYGKSEGKPHEAGVLADARAARAWLAKRAGVAETDIVMMGESLGGAVAVDLAAKDGAKALIVESTFTSLPDVAAHYYPWLPVRWVMRSRLDSLSLIAKYHGPLLTFHGDSDTIIPFAFGQRLFEAANEPKKFVREAGRDHNDPRSQQFWREVKAFLEEVGKSS